MIETKSHLLHLIRQERAAWHRLLEEIGGENFEKLVTPEGWNMKDIIAHLTTWRRWALAGLEAWRRNEPAPDHPPQSNVPHINDWVRLTNHDRPLVHILRDDQETWQQFEAAIHLLPEGVLFAPTQITWLEGQPLGPGILDHFVGHFHEEHEAEIRAWLAKINRPV